MVKILLSGNPDLLESEIKRYEKSGSQSITIEAEYGDRVVEGSILTLAHHGTRKDNPCPCLYQNNGEINLRVDDPTIIGLSHVDLDTMLALIAVLGTADEKTRKKSKSFFNLAAFVDVNGVHKLHSRKPSEKNLQKYYACEHFIRMKRPKIMSDEVKDVTNELVELAFLLSTVLKGHPETIAEGEKFKKELEGLNKDSFVDKIGDVIVRVSPDFVNHLYETPTGELGKAMVAFYTPNGNITVSFADPIPGLSCREIVQQLWGSEAGGHDGIAGSPRGRRMKYIDFQGAIYTTIYNLSKRRRNEH